MARPRTVPTLTRRQVLRGGAVAAGGQLFPIGGRAARATNQPAVKHLFSLIGEFSQTGAYVASQVTGPDAIVVDMAVSTFPDMRSATFVGAKAVDPTDQMVRHDIDGLLAPGTSYYLRLSVGVTMFGRTMSFRTQVADNDPVHLKVALLSCQRNVSTADLTQPSWRAVRRYRPDLLLHGGDFGYFGGVHLTETDPYTKHINNYARQLTGLTKMRSVIESCCSLIQVSDHETSANNGDTYNDPITEKALRAYWRLMPFRSFDDATRRSRFMTRKIGTNVLLIAPDFRGLDRSPGAWPDDVAKTAYGEYQFALLVAALKRPEALKILLSDPGANPADRPSTPDDPWLLDKWCNYQSAYQAMSDVVRNERTTDGKAIQLEVWCGDRHYVSCLAAANNKWGPFDVLTASGVDKLSLPLMPGETFDQAYGYTPEGELDRTVHQHMEIDLRDDKAGTITRVARGIDDVTGTVVVHSKKKWTY